MKKDTADWREFELLVSRIEQTLAPKGAQVKSPDKIPDLITGSKREVDASIRYKIGTVPILITVECRKRDSIQDDTWIEQLATKKQKIGAARTIAVSSAGLTKPATVSAKHYGIDLRVLSEIKNADIENWLFPSSFIHLHKYADVLSPPNILFEMEKGDTEERFGNSKGNFEDKIFQNSIGEILSLSELWDKAQQQLDIYSKVPKNGQVLNTKVQLKITDDLMIITEVGPRKVSEIELRLALSWKRETIPLNEATMVEYVNVGDNSASPIGRAEIVTKEAKNNFRLGMQLEKDTDQMYLTVEMLGSDKVES